MPQAGRDYPGTWQALQAWFPDDDACRAYLERLRWPDGFVCPACGGTEAWRTAAGLFMCAGCQRKTSVTAGTIFHRSRLPLTSWFAACWFVCSQKNGVSALGLQRVLGFGSYETAWAWLHKLRRAMVRPDRERLSGVVEVDETIVGGREHAGRRARGLNKAVVSIAIEIHEPKGFGRVRLARLPEVSAATIRGFIAETVEPGSTVRTDGWSLYPPITKLGYRHEPVNVVRSAEAAHVLLPGVHRVASLLKRWLAGTLHHGYSHNQLDYYLDEFTFRFNRRNARQRGLLFYRLLEQAVRTSPHPLGELTANHNI
jgi:transposase-like protein